MQDVGQLPVAITPLNLAIAVFLAFLIVDKIAFWGMKLISRNGNGKQKDKDDTKAMLKPLFPCKDDPRWLSHITDTHDTYGIVKENKGIVIAVKDALIEQAHELKTQTKQGAEQTKILREIANNGRDK